MAWNKYLYGVLAVLFTTGMIIVINTQHNVSIEFNKDNTVFKINNQTSAIETISIDDIKFTSSVSKSFKGENISVTRSSKSGVPLNISISTKYLFNANAPDIESFPIAESITVSKAKGRTLVYRVNITPEYASRMKISYDPSCVKVGDFVLNCKITKATQTFNIRLFDPLVVNSTSVYTLGVFSSLSNSTMGATTYLDYSGNTAYVISEATKGFGIVNITNISAMTMLSVTLNTTSLNLPRQVKCSGVICAIASYSSTTGANGSLTMFNITSLTAPTQIYYSSSNITFYRIKSLAISGNILYTYSQNVTSGTSSYFKIWNITNPASPTQLGNLEVPFNSGSGLGGGMIVEGLTVYVMDGSLLIFNVTSNTTPTLISNRSTGSNMNNGRLNTSNRLLYTTGTRLAIYNVSNLSNPISVFDSTIGLSGGIAQAVDFDNLGKLYVTSYVSTSPLLSVYSITDPINPVYLTNYSTTGAFNQIRSVRFVNGYPLVVANPSTYMLIAFNFSSSSSYNVTSSDYELGTLMTIPAFITNYTCVDLITGQGYVVNDYMCNNTGANLSLNIPYFTKAKLYNSSSSVTCYQESANVSNQSGTDTCSYLNYTGKYALVCGDAAECPPSASPQILDAIDGSWTSHAFMNGDMTIYANYSYPNLTSDKMVGGAIFRSAQYTSQYNYTASSSCINNPIQVKYYMPTASGIVYVYCYGGGSWITLGSYSPVPNVFTEEAIYWIIDPAPTNTVFNLTYAAPGNQTIYLKSHHEDQAINFTMNLTGYNISTSYPTVNIYVNNTLVNGVGYTAPTNVLTTFNDSTSSKKLQFNSTSVQTVYLRLPKLASVTAAQFNISGSNNVIDNCYQENANQVSGCGGLSTGYYRCMNLTSGSYCVNSGSGQNSVVDISAYYDSNWSTRVAVGYPTYVNRDLGSDEYILVNWIKPPGLYNFTLQYYLEAAYGIKNFSITSSHGCFGSANNLSIQFRVGNTSNFSCYNYTSNLWVYVDKSYGVMRPYEDAAYLNMNLTSTNSYIRAGLFDKINDWSNTTNFTFTNTVSGLSASINTALGLCTTDSYGYCNIPIYVSLSPGGYINISNIVVNYTYAFNPVSININNISAYLNNSSGYVYVPIKIESTTNGTLGISAIKYDYIGGSESYNITVHDNTTLTYNFTTNIYYSGWNYTHPQYINYIEFIPRTSTSKNVTPYGQTDSVPIMNITSTAYINNYNFSLLVNDSLPCVNITVSKSNNKTAGTLLGSNTWQELITNVTYQNVTSFWMWADLNCNYTQWKIWNPEFNFRACALNTDCVTTVN